MIDHIQNLAKHNFIISITLWVALFCSAGYGHSQALFNISPSPCITYGDTSNTVWTCQANLTNLSATDSVFNWKRVINNLPTGWLTAVCDDNLCYPVQADSSTKDIIIPFQQPWLGQLIVHFYAMGIPGSGTVVICAFRNSNPSEMVCDTFIAHVIPAGIDTQKEGEGVSVYPNPVKNTAYINYPQSTVSLIEITNIFGKILNRTPVISGSRNAEIDLSRHPPGIYIAHLFSANTLIKSVKIIKTSD
jgi:hypothetical protein